MFFPEMFSAPALDLRIPIVQIRSDAMRDSGTRSRIDRCRDVLPTLSKGRRFMNRLPKIMFAIALTGLIAAAPLSVQAVVVTWTNAGTGDFANGANWSSSAFPTTADFAAIQNGGTGTLVVTAPNTIHGLYLGSTTQAGHLVLDTGADLTIAPTSASGSQASKIGIANSVSGTMSTLDMKGNAKLTNLSAGTTNNWLVMGNQATANIYDRSVMKIQDTATASLMGFQVGGYNSAALYQTGGTLQKATKAGVTTTAYYFGLGVNDANSYGYYDLSGGTISNTDVSATATNYQLHIGYNGTGVFRQSEPSSSVPAAVAVGASFQLGSNNAAAYGEYSMSGGTADFLGGTNSTIHQYGRVGGTGMGVINLSGGTMTFHDTVNLGAVNNASSKGVINIGIAGTAAGTLVATQLQKPVAASTGVVNFHGGALKVLANDGNANFLNGTTNYVYGGGAKIDTDGNDATISNALLAPDGNGVSSIAVATSGADYLGAPAVKIVNAAGDLAGKGATAVAVMSADGKTVTGITITNPGTGYTAAPTVTLAGGGSLTAATLGAVNLNSGNASGGLTKEGLGTLTLSGNNTYTGMTTVNGGTLKIAGANALPGQATVNSSGTLSIATTMSLSDRIFGSGNLAISSGTVTLGSNAFSGTLVGNGGNLVLNATHPGNFVVNNGVSCYYSGSGTVSGLTTVGNPMMFSSQDALLGGTGALGNVTVLTNYGNTFGVKGGLEAGQNGVGSLSMSNLAINGPAFLYLGNSTLGILDPYKTTPAFIASGTLIVGAETFGDIQFDLGGTTVASGTYHLIQHNGAINYQNFTGIGNFQVANAVLSGRQSASIVDNAGSGSTRYLDYVVSGFYPVWTGLVGGAATDDTWYQNNSAKTNWKASNSSAATYFIDGNVPTPRVGDAVLFDDTGTGHTTVSIPTDVAPTMVTVDSTLNYTFGGAGGIVDSTFASAPKTSLVKKNNGTLTINTANTFSGGTLIYDGAIRIGNAAALGTGSVAFVAGAPATAKLQANGQNGTLGGLQTDAVAPGAPVVENGGGANATLTIGNATANTYAGTMQDGSSGKLAVEFAGSAPFVLAGAATYSGATTLSGVGGLQLGIDDALPHGAGKGNLVFNYGTLDLNGHQQTINGMSSIAGGTITNNLLGATNTLTVGDNNTSSTFGGSLLDGIATGKVALAKIGSGTLTLPETGIPNTYSGGTTLSAGTIQTAFITALGTGSLNMNASATLDLLNAFSTDFEGNVIPSLNVGALSGSGLVTTSTPGNFAMLTVTSPAGTSTFDGLMQNGSGNMSFTKAGPGTLALSANHPYTGATRLNAGTLSAATLANGGATSPIGASTADAANLVFNGGTLLYTGATTTIDRGFTSAGGAAGGIGVDNSATVLELTGAVTNTGIGTFVKSGAGTLVLGNANLYHFVATGGAFKPQTGSTTNTTGDFVIGNVAGNAAKVVLQNPTLATPPELKPNRLFIGNYGAGALYLTENTTLNTNATAATNGWYLAYQATGYGYLELADTATVTNTVMNQMQVGNRGAAVVNQSGNSTMELSAISLCGGSTTSYAYADYNMSGGTLTLNKTDYNSQVGYRGAGVINLSGGTMSFSHDIGAGAIYVGWKGGTGIVNIGVNGTPGGTLAVTSLYREALAGNTGIVNFHGGTLKAIASATGLNAKFLDNTTNYIYSEGARIDTDGNDVTIASALDAPTGNGVASIALMDGGSGYIGIPIVKFDNTGTGGSGATAVANFDKATGTVTGITITNPGTGYASAPTATLVGGGATTAATLGAAALNAGNVSGGLTKLGAGTLTVMGPLSYSGPTVINAGTLQISTPGAVTLSTISGAGGLKITDATTLTANSIAVGTLTIGGPAPAAAVPEPASLILLVVAAMALAGSAWWKRR
jgi:fibronectin-binding autotransporter adhesin